MKFTVAGVNVGDTRRLILVDNLTRTQLVQYAGASGDYNPLHTDELYATNIAGFPTVFAHGMLTMGMTGRLLTDVLGDSNLVSFGARFTAQVWPGDTLTGLATVQGIHRADGETIIDLSLSTTNQDNVEVLSGYATGRLSS